MALTPPAPLPPLPPASAECTATLQPAQPGSLPQKISYTMSRSADGKMRIDYPTSSVITDPATGQITLLDHLKKEVRTIQAPAVAPPQLPGQPKIPGMPAAPAPPGTTPPMTIKDLGKRFIEGHEVAGKQITMPPVAPPSLTPPQPPGVPQPQIPGMPNAPQLPPKPDPKTLVSEVWTSTSLHIPVLTRITGSFGQQMCHCKNPVGGEPPPSTFQIPPDYKQVGLPSAPKAPAMPAAPAMPKAPAMPAMPAMPKPPAAPSMPKLPAMPKPPSAS